MRIKNIESASYTNTDPDDFENPISGNRQRRLTKNLLVSSAKVLAQQ